MATVAQILNRRSDSTPDKHYTATIIGVDGGGYRVAIEPGGTHTLAARLDGRAFAAGARVLIIVTSTGNYILGTI
jgi:hypothetical protein